MHHWEPLCDSQSTTASQKSGTTVCHIYQRIIGPVFFEGSVDVIAYLHIFYSLRNSWTMSNSLKVTSSKIVQLVTCQKNPWQWSRNFSADRVICRSVATTIMQLNPSWFLFVGLLQGTDVPEQTTHNWHNERGHYTLNQMRSQHNTEITTNNMQHQIQMCLAEDGVHFQHTMYCQFVPRKTRYVSNQQYHDMHHINIITSCSLVRDLQLSVWVSFYMNHPV
jgi:hypothetical protein